MMLNEVPRCAADDPAGAWIDMLVSALSSLEALANHLTVNCFVIMESYCKACSFEFLAAVNMSCSRE